MSILSNNLYTALQIGSVLALGYFRPRLGLGLAASLLVLKVINYWEIIIRECLLIICYPPLRQRQHEHQHQRQSQHFR